MFPQVNIRLQQIARLKVAGLKREQIAKAVGLTPAGVDRILALDEYKAEEEKVLAETVGAMDRALVGKADLIRQEAREAVPVAIRTLLETARQRKDLRAALAASKEILDRDPDRTLPQQRSASQADGLGQNFLGQPALPSDQMSALLKENDNMASKKVN